MKGVQSAAPEVAQDIDDMISSLEEGIPDRKKAKLLRFEKLRKFVFRNGEELTEVYLDGPGLQEVDLRDNPKLRKAEVGSPEKVDIGLETRQIGEVDEESRIQLLREWEESGFTGSVREMGLRGLEPLVVRTIKIENIEELEVFEGEEHVTNLMRAAFAGRIDLVRGLLESEPESIDVQTPKTGTTALMLASQEQREEVVQYLLEKGADLNKRRNDRMDALTLSGLKGEKETFQLIKDWMFEKIKDLDPDHPSVAFTLGNMGNAYRALGRTEEALKINEKSLGPDHPEVGMTVANIGLIYKGKKEYKKALGYFERTEKIFRKMYPGSHPYVERSQRDVEVIKKLIQEQQER